MNLPAEGRRRQVMHPIASSIMVVVSLVFLHQGWLRMADLRATGQPVDPYRVMHILFWVFCLYFWSLTSYSVARAYFRQPR